MIENTQDQIILDQKVYSQKDKKAPQFLIRSLNINCLDEFIKMHTVGGAGGGGEREITYCLVYMQ